MIMIPDMDPQPHPFSFPQDIHSFLQSDIWAEFRKSLGWKVHRHQSILILERELPLGKTFLYSPEVIAEPGVLSELIPFVQEIGERHHALFYRLELLIDKSSELAGQWQPVLKQHRFRKAFESVQPDDRQVISLTDGEDSVFAQLKSKGRYHVRIAHKAGVHVRKSNPESLETDIHTFYQLLKETAERQKFSVRPESYFLTLCRLLYTYNYGRLFVAEYNQKPLAAAIITNYDRFASYLYGASSESDSQVKAPYLLHWEAMRWAMEQGAEWYDLLAIRPDNVPEGKSHPYDGITQFKERFGGQSFHLMGSWDLTFQPLWYNLFKLAEKTRR